MIMKQFKYISNITTEELESNWVLPCINEDGFNSILIKNSVEKTVPIESSTDNLNVKLNAVLLHNSKKFYFHIITSKRNDVVANAQFEVVYEYLFKKITESVLDSDLSNLITSIEEYFKISPDLNTKNLQIGVYGELLCIKILYENGYHEILEKYHNNFYSKHDVEISSKIRLEIKTTSTEKRIHSFKHNQIHRDDVDVFVGSSIIETAQEGYSLFDLFEEIINLYPNPESKFSLEKLKQRCGVTNENKGITAALEKAYCDYKFFDAKELPQLKEQIPNGVTSITYDVDCSLSNEISIDNLITIFNK